MWHIKTTIISAIICISFQCYAVRFINLNENEPCYLNNGLVGTCKTDADCRDIIEAASRRAELSRDDVVYCKRFALGYIVCCPHQSNNSVSEPTITTVKSLPPITEVPTTTSTEASVNLRKADIACERFRKKKQTYGLSQKFIALLSNIMLPFYRTFGGTPAKLSEFPYQVGIARFSENSNYSVFCGGTLIDKFHVLTAAHCVNESESYLVLMGVVNFKDAAQIKQAKEAMVKKIIIHDDYYYGSFYNDIAILALANETVFNKNIAPACLYTDMADPHNSTDMYVSGWGYTSINPNVKRYSSDKLMYIKLKPFEIRRCHNAYVERVPYLPTRGIDQSFICAYDPEYKKDACSGDSGGPMVMTKNENKETFRLAGVVVSGNGCGAELPSLYIRVANYLDWIETVVWPDDFQ